MNTSIKLKLIKHMDCNLNSDNTIIAQYKVFNLLELIYKAVKIITVCQ